MLEILVIQKPQDNHIEFEWKVKFLMKIYESACWHGGNSSYSVATNRFWHLHHVEFDVKFTFFLKIYEVTWKLGWNTSHLVATIWVSFPNLLSLVSNLGSCWNFMQLHEKIVEIHLIWWPPNGFNSPTCWIWFQLQLFVENLCNYMKKWLKYVLFGGH